MAVKKFTFAHMSRKEMGVLDTLQGVSYRLEGLPYVHVYTGAGSLEEKLEDENVLNSILDKARKKYATGGKVGISVISKKELEKFRRQGRNGDDGVAVLGPRTRALLDMLAGHVGVHPETNAPEYFSLGGLFDSIGSGFKSLVGNTLGKIPGIGSVVNGAMDLGGKVLSPITNTISQMAPSLAGAAGTALGSAFGSPQIGSMIGNMAGQLLQDPSQQGQPTQQMSPEQAMQHMQNAGMQGINQGMQHLQQQGPLGGMAANFAQNLMGGQNLQQAAGNGIGQLANHFGGQGSMVGQMGQHLGQAMQQPGFNPMDFARQQYQNMTGGGSGGGGGFQLSPQMLHGGMNAMGSLMNSFRQGMNPMQMLMNAHQAYQQPMMGSGQGGGAIAQPGGGAMAQPGGGYGGGLQQQQEPEMQGAYA